MGHEWNKYLEGFIAFKENQGALWFVCIALVIVLWNYKKNCRNVFLIGSLVLGVLTTFPLTAIGLLKIYTPFYDWLDLQQLFPVTLLAAWFGVELFDKIQHMNIQEVSIGKFGKSILAGMVVVIILASATVFHGFDNVIEVQENGIPVKTAKVFEALYQTIGEQEITLAAPDEMLSVSRMYSADWHPIYGKDLWSPKAASYINSGYDKEYAYYEIFSSDGLNEERAEQLTALINEIHADCIIVFDYWIPYLGETPEFEMLDLYPGYVGIIKKELMKR